MRGYAVLIAFTRELYVRLDGALPGQRPRPIYFYLGCLAFLLISILSECSYRFIEAPLRALGIPLHTSPTPDRWP
jgi:peptidoglycan/LPS O-acetylase OafA/YrhL